MENGSKVFFLIFEQIKNIQIFTNFQFFHDHSAVTVALKNIKFGMQPKRTKQVEKWVRRWSDGQYSRRNISRTRIFLGMLLNTLM